MRLRVGMGYYLLVATSQQYANEAKAGVETERWPHERALVVTHCNLNVWAVVDNLLRLIRKMISWLQKR